MLIHYTLNSGHSRQIGRPLLASGDHTLPNPLQDYRVVVPAGEHSLVFTVFRGSAPLIN
jgi:hypothetical protein